MRVYWKTLDGRDTILRVTEEEGLEKFNTITRQWEEAHEYASIFIGDILTKEVTQEEVRQIVGDKL